MASGNLLWQTTPSIACPATCVAEQAASESRHISPEELETLYMIRRPEMIRFLVRFGVDVVEAEDITQEVFLRVFDKPQQQKRPENLFHWVLACARNLAINRYHRSRRECLAPAERWKSWEMTLADKRASAEDCMYRKECQLRLVWAVAQLDAVEQQCLVMRSRGITFREIASALNVPMQSAVYATDTAIKKLQRKMQPVRQ